MTHKRLLQLTLVAVGGGGAQVGRIGTRCATAKPQRTADVTGHGGVDDVSGGRPFAARVALRGQGTMLHIINQNESPWDCWFTLNGSYHYDITQSSTGRNRSRRGLAGRDTLVVSVGAFTNRRTEESFTPRAHLQLAIACARLPGSPRETVGRYLLGGGG